MKKKKYSVHNYGNTRSVSVKGQPWEISKNTTIEIDNSEVAAAFDEMLFIDVEVIKQPSAKKETTKKKATVRKTRKKKATPLKKYKKFKRRKNLRRKK